MISLITGVGAKGQVGEAVASALAARGDTVLLASRNAAEVESRAEELRATGARATAYACDLSDPAAVDTLAARVRADHGDRLDALVNLAGGFARSGPLAQSDPAVFSRMMQINVVTALLATRAFLPMLTTARGAIVFFASEVVADGVPTRGVSAYAASKAAVVALMRSVADEGREAGVRANALAPAAIRTASNQVAMRANARFVEREDVAAAVAFLCSAEARAVSGQVIRLR